MLKISQVFPLEVIAGETDIIRTKRFRGGVFVYGGLLSYIYPFGRSTSELNIYSSLLDLCFFSLFLFPLP